MTSEVAPGAQVEHDGMTIGTVERLEIDGRTGQLAAVLVRHGRADYLLRVPASHLAIESPSRLELKNGTELDELEQVAVDSGRTPPEGAHLTDAGHTEASPAPGEVLGGEPGLPSGYDGPGTG